MNLETIEELEGKFEYLKKHKSDPQKIEPLLSDYTKYLGANKPLGGIVRRLALNDEIPVSVLKGIFGSFMVPQMSNLFKEISYPPFWDNTIEEKFHLQSDFQKFSLNLNERIYKKNRDNSSKDEMAWATEAYPILDFKVVENLHGKILEKVRKQEKLAVAKKGNYLKSIHLITETLSPTSVIFLVLDEHYEKPVRCKILNDQGYPTYIKRLHDLAYRVNVPGKSVPYNTNLSDRINNALFKLRQVSDYMKTNHLSKPTLVKISEDGKILVLKNEVTVEAVLVKSVPQQYQYLYIDKTR